MDGAEEGSGWPILGEGREREENVREKEYDSKREERIVVEEKWAGMKKGKGERERRNVPNKH